MNCGPSCSEWGGDGICLFMIQNETIECPYEDESWFDDEQEIDGLDHFIY